MKYFRYFLFLNLLGCSVTPLIVPQTTISIPFDHLHPRIQKSIGITYRNNSLKACGKMVAIGDWDNPPLMEEAPWGRYYNNRTGRHIANCGMGVENPLAVCPPKGWSCEEL